MVALPEKNRNIIEKKLHVKKKILKKNSEKDCTLKNGNIIITSNDLLGFELAAPKVDIAIKPNGKREKLRTV